MILQHSGLWNSVDVREFIGRVILRERYVHSECAVKKISREWVKWIEEYNNFRVSRVISVSWIQSSREGENDSRLNSSPADSVSRSGAGDETGKEFKGDMDEVLLAWDYY
jgi:hypothetical protein